VIKQQKFAGVDPARVKTGASGWVGSSAHVRSTPEAGGEDRARHQGRATSPGCGAFGRREPNTE
jgi:hypothetical protein